MACTNSAAMSSPLAAQKKKSPSAFSVARRVVVEQSLSASLATPLASGDAAAARVAVTVGPELPVHRCVLRL